MKEARGEGREARLLEIAAHYHHGIDLLCGVSRNDATITHDRNVTVQKEKQREKE